MASSATGPYRARRRPGGARVRWDKVGRIGMLIVLCVLVYLYVSPGLRLLSTEHEAGSERSQAATLERQNAQLRARRNALERSGTIEQEARQLGMVRPGEQGYVIQGLPNN
jgi:cell division protein FtsB